MEGAFGAKKNSRRPIINITPLIDVMFLLLIFFMVSSTFREHLGIDVTLPEATTAAEQENASHDITVQEDGSFHLGQQRVSAEELRQSLRDLLEDSPGATLVLRADEAAEFQDVITAIDIAREVGGSKLVIPTRPRAPEAANTP